MKEGIKKYTFSLPVAFDTWLREMEAHEAAKNKVSGKSAGRSAIVERTVKEKIVRLGIRNPGDVGLEG